MVGYYSSYLEFLGAVYFSMSLDDILKKKVWTPQDSRKQRRVLSALDDRKDENLSKALVDANQAKGKKLQQQLTKKSIVGIFVIAFLLFFSGCEEYVETNCRLSLYSLQLELAYLMTFFLFTQIIFSKIVYSQWKYTVIYIFMIFLMFGLIHGLGLTYGHTCVELFITRNIGIYVCTIMTLPVLWQIFITWMYKSIFYGFIKNKIIVAKENYEHVINNINEGNYQSIPKEYYNIYMRISQSSPDTTVQQAMDDTLTEYKGVLYNEIRTIGNNVTIADLFWSWVNYKFKTTWHWLVAVCRTKGNPDRLAIKDFEYYAKKYKRMKVKDASLKMKSFCNDEGIDFDEFNTYYASYCSNSSKLK